MLDIIIQLRRDTEWEWGHENHAHGMDTKGMCGPFFGRNLSAIISMMTSKTNAELQAERHYGR